MKQFLCLGVCFGFRLVSWGRGGGGTVSHNDQQHGDTKATPTNDLPPPLLSLSQTRMAEG